MKNREFSCSKVKNREHLHPADRLIIDWNQIPRGKRENPFTASRLEVIKGRWTGEINLAIRRLGFFDCLTKVDTPKLTELWKRDSRMEAYGAHNIKRGAVKYIFEKQQLGLDIPLTLISRLAKHEKPTDIRDKAKICRTRALALSLLTARVTEHL